MSSAIICSQTSVRHHRIKALLKFGNVLNYTKDKNFQSPPLLYLNSNILAFVMVASLPLSLKAVLVTKQYQKSKIYC